MTTNKPCIRKGKVWYCCLDGAYWDIGTGDTPAQAWADWFYGPKSDG